MESPSKENESNYFEKRDIFDRVLCEYLGGTLYRICNYIFSKSIGRNRKKTQHISIEMFAKKSNVKSKHTVQSITKKLYSFWKQEGSLQTFQYYPS
jgi:hypothetical protein